MNSPLTALRHNTVSTALLSSALRHLANSSHLPQQSHIIGPVLAFVYMAFRVLLFSILVPYRDFEEQLPHATAQEMSYCRLLSSLKLYVCVCFGVHQKPPPPPEKLAMFRVVMFMFYDILENFSPDHHKLPHHVAWT